MNEKNGKAGYSLVEWCEAVGVSRASFYTWTNDSRPKQVKIGKRLIIFEPPQEWLLRISKLGGIASPERDPVKLKDIRDVFYSTRTRNVLDKLGARTLGDVCQLTHYQILRTKDCGRKTINDIKEGLAEYGLSLAGEEERCAG